MPKNTEHQKEVIRQGQKVNGSRPIARKLAREKNKPYKTRQEIYKAADDEYLFVE